MAKQLLTVLKHFHGLHWLLPISLLLVSLSFISFTGDPSALKKQTRSIVVIGPPTSKLATHLYDADPIRFTLQTDKQNVRVNEEIAITITAHYLNIASSLLFTAEGSNAFRLKVLLPDGFVQTGGNYIDYVGAELSAVNPTISYTLKGHFIKHSSQSEFRLLRGIYQANANSLFVQKAQIVIQVTVNDAPVSLFQKARSGGCSYSEGQYLFTTGWGESAYAHYYNGVLFAAYQNGSSFKPRHWLVATGMMDANTANCFAEDDPHTVAVNPTPSGACTYAEGQYLFTTSWGEVVYAHFYNGVLFAAFKDGSNFKPQHWLAATGMMTTTVATCFAENDPHTTSTPAPTTPTIPSTPTGNCGYTEGQYLFTFGTEPIYAHFYNSVLFAAYQNGSNFKPQHWLVATGLMTSSAASCFAENDPHTSTPTTPSITPSPSGNCGTGSGLTGFYSNSTDLSKNLAAVRTDGQINFTWNDSPIPGVVNADGFSIRWFGQIEAPTSGNYTFKTNNDDGTRLWVNGQQLIEDWNGHGPTWQQGSLYLNAGQKYEIILDYFDLLGGAQSQLYWEYPGQSLQLVPDCRLYPKTKPNSARLASDTQNRYCVESTDCIDYLVNCKTKEVIDAVFYDCETVVIGNGPHYGVGVGAIPTGGNGNPIGHGSGGIITGGNGNTNPTYTNMPIPTTAHLDGVDCDKISGWAFANAGGYANLDVYLTDPNGGSSGRLIKAATIKAANSQRPDVRSAYNNNLNIPLDCGFVWAIPDAYKTGLPIKVRVVPANNITPTGDIQNSPLTSSDRCSPPQTTTPVSTPWTPGYGVSPLFTDKPIDNYTPLEIISVTNRIYGDLGITSVDQLEKPPYLQNFLYLEWFTQYQQVSRESYVLKQMNPGWSDSKCLVQAYKNVLFGKVHFLLDVFGVVPGAGDIADGINGGVYLLEGDRINASLSFAATIPIAGWAATGGKWAKKGLQAVGNSTFLSAEGIVWASRKYGSDPVNTHALSHVYEHFNNSTKKNYHGIFTIPTNELVELVDAAWIKVKNNAPGVARTTGNGNISYSVPMGSTIGTQGGLQGSGKNLDRLRIIVDGQNPNHIVTAFPE